MNCKKIEPGKAVGLGWKLRLWLGYFMGCSNWREIISAFRDWGFGFVCDNMELLALCSFDRYAIAFSLFVLFLSLRSLLTL